MLSFNLMLLMSNILNQLSVSARVPPPDKIRVPSDLLDLSLQQTILVLQMVRLLYESCKAIVQAMHQFLLIKLS